VLRASRRQRFGIRLRRRELMATLAGMLFAICPGIELEDLWSSFDAPFGRRER